MYDETTRLTEKIAESHKKKRSLEQEIVSAMETYTLRIANLRKELAKATEEQDALLCQLALSFTPTPAPAPPPPPPAPTKNEDANKERRKMWAILNDLGFEEEVLRRICQDLHGTRTTKGMTASQIARITKRIETRGEKYQKEINEGHHPDLDPAVCKGSECGKSIFWGISVKGNRTPVDYMGKVKLAEKGQTGSELRYIFNQDGRLEMRHVIPVPSGEKGAIQSYEGHHVTCPNAPHFKKG